VDGSPGAFSALVWAVAAAARSGAGLEVVSAFPTDDFWRTSLRETGEVDTLRADTEAHAQAFVADAVKVPELTAVPGTSDVPVQVTAAEGAPAHQLVRRASGARLLVVGSRGRGGVRSTLLGSVALHCAASAPCPVVVVHPAQPAPAPRVVVGLDETDVSRAALARAVEEAGRLGAAVEAVVVASPFTYWSDAVAIPKIDDQVQSAQRRGQHVVEQVLGDRHGIRIDVVGDLGSPGDVLVRQAEGASLLVVGSRSHSRTTGMLLGSVALHSVVHAPCPVMVVHPEPDGAAAGQ
jgi:nucleotide-binding universal stress UspA family protein